MPQSTSATQDQREDYALAHSYPETDVLRRLREETEQTVERPHMLSGPLQGALLRMLVQLTGARNVLEIGTFTGYSALWLAGALPGGGMLHTIEADERLKPIAERHIQEAGLEGKITLHTGKGSEVLSRLPGPFDLAFIDADKKGYPAYYEAVLPLMRSGGLLLLDNTLFHGEVLLSEGERGAYAEVIAKLNARIAADDRVEVVLLPLRDGLTLIRKR